MIISIIIFTSTATLLKMHNMNNICTYCYKNVRHINKIKLHTKFLQLFVTSRLLQQPVNISVLELIDCILKPDSSVVICHKLPYDQRVKTWGKNKHLTLQRYTIWGVKIYSRFVNLQRQTTPQWQSYKTPFMCYLEMLNLQVI